jgi:hypothetical protein
MYDDGPSVWAGGDDCTHKVSNPNATLDFTSSGKLEKYAANGSILCNVAATTGDRNESMWCGAPGTSPTDTVAELAILQPSDGNFVLYGGDPFGPLWVAFGPCPPLPNAKGNKCTGSSTQLPAAQCNAWIKLFEATDGPHWNYCTESRTDPCSCKGFQSRSQFCNADATGVVKMYVYSSLATLGQ